MAFRQMGPDLLDLVADRFKALSDSGRMQLLQALRNGPRSVTELAQDTHMGQANVSRQLTRLFHNGFVTRHRDGAFVRYALTDNEVLELCDLMCGRIDHEAKSLQSAITGQ